MSKPQLSTYSKAILLKHRIRYGCNHPEDDEISAFDFFKYLLISRDFLRASQLYPVYHFAIFNYLDSRKFSVSAMKDEQISSLEIWCELTLKEIQTWNRLLNVQYVLLYPYTDVFSAVSRIFTGRIALNLPNGIVYNAKKHGGIIRQIQKQLYYLECDANSLLVSSEVRQLNLKNCVLKIRDLYQFKQVMAKHKIKQLSVRNTLVLSSRYYANIDDNFFSDFSTCPSVEKLEFFSPSLDEDHDFIPKITQMMPFFPNLSELVVQTEHCTFVPFVLQEWVAWTREEFKKIEELQTASPDNTNLNIHYLFEIHQPVKKEIINQLVEEILKTPESNKVHPADHCILKPNNNEKDALVKQRHYEVELRKIQPNCRVILRFKVTINPLR